MKIEPLYDRVLVKRFPEETKTESGIVIPDSAKEKPSKGEVKYVGKGKRTDDGKQLEMTVKVGDQILFGKYAGQEITVDDEELLVMHESDIVAIVS